MSVTVVRVNNNFTTHVHHHHLSLNCKGHWGTTDDFTTSFLHFSLFSTAPCPDVFPPLPLSASSSSPFHCVLHLQDGFGQTCWTGDMTIPLQFESLYDGQEVFLWSNCLLDLGTDFLIGNMVLVRCVVSCSSTSFPWLVVFFGALLWGSMIHKHTGIWMWQGSASVVPQVHHVEAGWPFLFIYLFIYFIGQCSVDRNTEVGGRAERA